MRGSVGVQGSGQAPMASTPGSFFQERKRTQSASETKAGAKESSVVVQSEVFNRYLAARERVQSNAKEYFENLNKNALDKVKYSKLSEKHQRDMN